MFKTLQTLHFELVRDVIPQINVYTEPYGAFWVNARVCCALLYLSFYLGLIKFCSDSNDYALLYGAVGPITIEPTAPYRKIRSSIRSRRLESDWAYGSV